MFVTDKQQQQQQQTMIDFETYYCWSCRKTLKGEQQYENKEWVLSTTQIKYHNQGLCSSQYPNMTYGDVKFNTPTYQHWKEVHRSKQPRRQQQDQQPVYAPLCQCST